MTYQKRLSLLVLLDSLIVLTSVYLCYWFLYPTQTLKLPTLVFVSSLTLLCCHHFFASIYKLYKKAWEYASIGELLSIFKAVTLSIIVTAII